MNFKNKDVVYYNINDEIEEMKILWNKTRNQFGIFEDLFDFESERDILDLYKLWKAKKDNLVVTFKLPWNNKDSSMIIVSFKDIKKILFDMRRFNYLSIGNGGGYFSHGLERQLDCKFNWMGKELT